MATVFLLLLLSSFSVLLRRVASEPLLPQSQIDAEALCPDSQDENHLYCELRNANLRISRLETMLEESVQSLGAKVNTLQELERLVVGMDIRIRQLHDSLSSTEGDSLRADKRLVALEEEVRSLWDTLRKNNFQLFNLESKAEESEEQLKALTSEVEKMAEIVTEQWIQIRQLEQALQISEMRFLKAQRRSGSTRCTFLKFIRNLYGNYISRKSEKSSFASEILHQIQTIWSAAKHYHHELQGFVKQRMERNKFTAGLATEELVFWLASAMLTFPIMGAWILLSSQFS